MAKVRFDSSLSVCVETVMKFVTSDVISSSAFIRDITGQLGVVLNCKLADKTKDELSASLIERLGAYARPYALVSDSNGFDSEYLLAEARVSCKVVVANQSICLLDRRVVGIDWLTSPIVQKKGTVPRIVFASIKGGVGRSTALCVAAAHLSQRGRRVLAIDFDLEAPGIGSMLLKEDELPQYGSLDFLVESQVSGFDNDLLANLVGSSYLGAAGSRVDVVPAIGKTTLEYPQNALSKIARAYLETHTEEDPHPITLGGKLKKLVELFEETGQYDVVLVDSRAGLHESTAGAMLALGGDVLLFGTDQPQTYQGYSLLFAHLAQFPIEPQNDWRDNLHFIHAKSGRTDKAKQESEGKFSDLFRYINRTEVFKDANAGDKLSGEDIELVWDESQDEKLLEEEIAPQVMHILDDGQYHDFDPINRNYLLEVSSFEHTFSDLIKFLDEEIDSTEEDG